MIVVKVELWPKGDKGRARSLGFAEIANTTHETGEPGSYHTTLFKWGQGRRVWRTGKITGFDRKNEGPWDLLLYCLWQCLEDRVRRRQQRSAEPKGGE